MQESNKSNLNVENVLYSLSGIIVSIEDQYIRASIRDGTERRTVLIKDIASFEKAGVLDVGTPFLYQFCRSNKDIYGKVIPRDLEPDEKPSEIEPGISELLERLEKEEAEFLKRTLVINDQ